MNDKKQILIVEDEPAAAMDIQKTLQNFGYDAAAAVSSGQAAIQEVQQNHPDLVLMNIALSGPMDGIEAAAQIRRDFGIPVVYLAANTEDITLDRALTAEPFGYLAKPFKNRELKAAIEIALCLAKNEKYLKAGKANFHNIVEKSDVGIMVVDENKILKFFNHTAKIMLGFKPGLVLGEKLDLPVIVGEVMDVEIAHGNSNPGTGEMHTVETEWEDKPAYLVSVSDITDRMRIEDETKRHMHDLEVFHEAAVGRELKMIELKEQITDKELEMTGLREQIAEFEAGQTKK
jgi:CheY-like chemotaxis protein